MNNKTVAAIIAVFVLVSTASYHLGYRAGYSEMQSKSDRIVKNLITENAETSMRTAAVAKASLERYATEHGYGHYDVDPIKGGTKFYWNEERKPSKLLEETIEAYGRKLDEMYSGEKR